MFLCKKFHFRCGHGTRNITLGAAIIEPKRFRFHIMQDFNRIQNKMQMLSLL